MKIKSNVRRAAEKNVQLYDYSADWVEEKWDILNEQLVEAFAEGVRWATKLERKRKERARKKELFEAENGGDSVGRGSAR